MFYQPDKFFYVLMLPAFFLIVVPLLWSLFVMLYKGYGRSRLADVRGYVEIDNIENVENGQHERRRDTRIRIEGPKALVANKRCCCKTTVTNISERGICLSNLPKKIFTDPDDKFHITFRSRERDYQIRAERKWENADEKGYAIGAEIVSAPEAWLRFLSDLKQ